MCVYAETVEKLDCTCTFAAWGRNLGWGRAGGRGGESGGKKSLTQCLWNAGRKSQFLGRQPQGDMCCAGQPGHGADPPCSFGGNGAGV